MLLSAIILRKRTPAEILQPVHVQQHPSNFAVHYRNLRQDPADTSLRGTGQFPPQVTALDVHCPTKKNGSLLAAVLALLNLTALIHLSTKSRLTPHHQFHKSTNKLSTSPVVESPLDLLRLSTQLSDVVPR